MCVSARTALHVGVFSIFFFEIQNSKNLILKKFEVIYSVNNRLKSFGFLGMKNMLSRRAQLLLPELLTFHVDGS